MKELIGIVLVGLFGFAIWKTRQAATTAPRCPTVDELEAINRDVLEGRTDLVDAENLAKSYDAIDGCSAASASIRASILAKKSAGVSTKVPGATAAPTGSAFAPVAGKRPIDVDALLLAPTISKEVGTHPLESLIDPLSVDALSSPIRENVKYLIGKPRSLWTSSDMAMYGALTGVGKPVSEACGGLQEGQILDDWFSRGAFQCDPTIDQYKAGLRKTVLADHPDNALSQLWAHSSGST